MCRLDILVISFLKMYIVSFVHDLLLVSQKRFRKVLVKFWNKCQNFSKCFLKIYFFRGGGNFTQKNIHLHSYIVLVHSPCFSTSEIQVFWVMQNKQGFFLEIKKKWVKFWPGCRDKGRDRAVDGGVVTGRVVVGSVKVVGTEQCWKSKKIKLIDKVCLGGQFCNHKPIRIISSTELYKTEMYIFFKDKYHNILIDGKLLYLLLFGKSYLIYLIYKLYRGLYFMKILNNLLQNFYKILEKLSSCYYMHTA